MNPTLQAARELYREAALQPQAGLCCTTAPIWQLPGLHIPPRMLEMNYGCGTTVHPRDLVREPKILYVGVGGGMELLQFAYFSRQANHVVGVDPVPEMIEACRENLALAEESNPWFSREYVSLREGDALHLPIEPDSVDVAAQNCLFNIFHEADLRRALAEIYRVLKPRGRLVLSDPTCEEEIPTRLRQDPRLRAACLSGALPLRTYLGIITETGFGTVEVRARRPYRVIDPATYGVDRPVYVESVEICAVKDPMPTDGPCVFTGRAAIYYGSEEVFDDGKGHRLLRNLPLQVCDKTASALERLGRTDLYITDSTWFYDGGGCC